MVLLYTFHRLRSDVPDQNPEASEVVRGVSTNMFVLNRNE